ncbi:MAG: RecX family transcriptional regulator [Oscillospiraceae bacterium]|nr:RecX family transcriptional regulator [Oscillospiraceae bacterium]
MKITKIEPSKKKGFSRIYLDGQFFMSLADEVITRRALKVGNELSEEQVPELSRAALVRRARERLLYALDRRLHSEKELREKLWRDYPPDIIDAAIAELGRLGLIDNSSFARAFCEHRVNSLKKGPYAIRQELILKGVSREVIDAALSEVFSDEDEEYNAARKAAEKYQSDIDTPKGKRRAFAALTRKGFSYSVIKRVMRELCDGFEEFED